MHNNLLHGNLIGKKQFEFCVQSIVKSSIKKKLALIVHTYEILKNVIHTQSG